MGVEGVRSPAENRDKFVSSKLPLSKGKASLHCLCSWHPNAGAKFQGLRHSKMRKTPRASALLKRSETREQCIERNEDRLWELKAGNRASDGWMPP